VPNCQKYTPTDCLFGDFAQWLHDGVLNEYKKFLSHRATQLFTSTKTYVWMSSYKKGAEGKKQKKKTSAHRERYRGIEK